MIEIVTHVLNLMPDDAGSPGTQKLPSAQLLNQNSYPILRHKGMALIAKDAA